MCPPAAAPASPSPVRRPRSAPRRSSSPPRTPSARSRSNIQNAIPGINVPGSGTDTLPITGTPTATGTMSFMVTVTDALGDSTSATVTLTVNPAVSLSPSTLPVDTQNVAYDAVITALSGTGAKTILVSNIQNPIPGINIPASSPTDTLTISGTPTA